MLTFFFGFVSGAAVMGAIVGILFLKFLEREENDWRGNGR